MYPEPIDDTAPSPRTSLTTTVLRVDPTAPAAEAIAHAAEVIVAGGLVAFPTETVYGLGANALDPDAVARIFAAKERAASDPLIVHIAEPERLTQVAREVPPLAEALAREFWPGPLTLVLPRQPAIPPAISAGLDTVAVRLPRHPVALAILRASGVPIAAPSANRFTRTSATTAEHVLEDLDGRIELVLDGGPANVGVESTVVAVEGRRAVILRPGAITLEELSEVALRVDPSAEVALVQRGARQASPGMMEKHYAPRAHLTYVRGPQQTTAARVRELVQEALEAGARVGVLAPSEECSDFDPAHVRVIDLGPEGDLEAMAHRLYAGLRALDAAGVERMFARQLGTGGLAAALDDRLRRAASNVIEAE